MARALGSPPSLGQFAYQLTRCNYRNARRSIFTRPGIRLLDYHHISVLILASLDMGHLQPCYWETCPGVRLDARPELER